MTEWWWCLSAGVRGFLFFVGGVLAVGAAGLVVTFLLGFVGRRLALWLDDKWDGLNIMTSDHWFVSRVQVGWAIIVGGAILPGGCVAGVSAILGIVGCVAYLIYDMIRCLVCTNC